ncbi:MAG: triacylglycerol lipase [Bacterioplanes sp.]|nr:triacylglycerol lipase [Bacterioplanes sp.]
MKKTVIHRLKKAAAGLLLAFGALLILPAQAAPKHPLVLVPGIFAFDSIGPLDYWFQIPSTLQRRGVEVYVAPINAFASSTERGEQLLAFLEDVQDASEGRIQRFNLIGHSQGGMTSRYVMYARPDLVASVTTVGTPHTGAPIADLITGVAPESSLQGLAFSTVANAVGNLVNLMASGNPRDASDIYGMMSEFNQPGAAQFNAQFPAGLPTTRCGNGADRVTIDGHSIRLYSWGGARQLTHVLDPSDALFAITGVLLKGELNDGITGVCANRFGRVINDRYRMNHIDLNNQVFGLVSWFETNPKSLFVNHAQRLQQAGL